MGVFDTLIWRAIRGARTQATDSGGALQGLTDPSAPGFTKQYTVTNPGTTYGTALEFTGTGYLLHLTIQKPATVNSVHVLVKVTVDGVVIATDVIGTITNTSTGIGILVGQVLWNNTASNISGPVAFLPFNKSLKVELKYSGTPGGSENATAYAVTSYTP